MTYPQELREHTRLASPSYPVNMFRNRIANVQQGSTVLWLHWHEHFEFIAMVAGRAVFHIDSQPYEAEPGDILIVPSGGLHVGYSCGEEDVEYVAIVFNAALLRSNASADPMHILYMDPILSGQVQSQVKLPGTEPSYDQHRFLIQQAIREFEAKDRAYELAVRSWLYLLCTLIARQDVPENLVRKTPALYARGAARFKGLLEHLEAHHAEPISVEQAAKQVNLNPYHFCKTFKKATGCTFVEYVSLLRMNEAERLLRESDLTVTEIAGRVGCGNANYFTKLFKRYKGRSPSQWRAMNL